MKYFRLKMFKKFTSETQESKAHKSRLTAFYSEKDIQAGLKTAFLSVSDASKPSKSFIFNI